VEHLLHLERYNLTNGVQMIEAKLGVGPFLFDPPEHCHRIPVTRR